MNQFRTRWMIQKDHQPLLDKFDLGAAYADIPERMRHCDGGPGVPVAGRKCPLCRWHAIHAAIPMVVTLVPEVPDDSKPDEIVGVFVYELYQKSLLLEWFEVDSDYRRQGAGRVIFEKMLSKLSSHRRPTLRLYVPESELGTHLFLKSLGIKAQRVQPNGNPPGIFFVEEGQADPVTLYYFRFNILQDAYVPEVESKPSWNPSASSSTS